MADDSPTKWIEQLAQGDELAAQRIWERYYERLIRLARTKLADTSQRASDEEDVVLSALKSFYRGAAAGRFPRLNDRDDLWKLLMTITCRKAVSQTRHDRRQKRGGGAVRGESALADGPSSQQGGGMKSVPSPQAIPDFAAMVAEQCQTLLDELHDESLHRVALMKLEGYSNKEIAGELGCSVATVERRLAAIRSKWKGRASDA